MAGAVRAQETRPPDELTAGYDFYKAANGDRTKGDNAQKDCRLTAALDFYEQAAAEAENGIAASHRHARRVPAEANRAAYTAALNYDERARALQSYDDIVGARFVNVRKTRPGVAAAYVAELAEFDLAQALGGLGAGRTDLFNYYRGTALIALSAPEAGIERLERFVKAGKGDLRFLEKAAGLIDSTRSKLAEDAAKAGHPVLTKHLTGAPLKLKDALPKCSGGAPLAIPSVTTFSFGTTLGYDDNLLNVYRGAVRAANAPEKGAFFYEADLVASSTWFTDVRRDRVDGIDAILADMVMVNYSASAIGYDAHDRRDSLVQVAGASYTRAVNARVAAGLIVNESWQRVHNRNVLNAFSIQPNVSCQLTDEISANVAYKTVFLKDFTRASPQANADGFTHVAALQFACNALHGKANATPAWGKLPGLPDGLLTFSPSYQHEWTLSDGILADRQRDDTLLKTSLLVCKSHANSSFLRSLTLSASYEFREDHYTHPAAPSLTAANRYRRRDDADVFDVALSLKMWYDEVVTNRLEFIAEYKLVKQDSNAPTSEFDDSRFLGSFKYNF